MSSILHVFANICGENFLNTSAYSLLLKVIKTTVMLIDGASEIVSKPDESIHPSFPACGICPFSGGSYHADGNAITASGKT